MSKYFLSLSIQLFTYPATTPVAGQPVPPSDYDKDDSDNSSTTPHTGSPAIKRTIAGAGPNSPAFTEQDVREYVESLRDTGFGKIHIEDGYMQVTSIPFLTKLELESLGSQSIAGNIHVPADTLLCYVEYIGSFTVQGPAGFEPLYFKHAAQVYNAHTGNFLAQTAYNTK